MYHSWTNRLKIEWIFNIHHSKITPEQKINGLPFLMLFCYDQTIVFLYFPFVFTIISNNQWVRGEIGTFSILPLVEAAIAPREMKIIQLTDLTRSRALWYYEIKDCNHDDSSALILRNEINRLCMRSTIFGGSKWNPNSLYYCNLQSLMDKKR